MASSSWTGLEASRGIEQLHPPPCSSRAICMRKHTPSSSNFYPQQAQPWARLHTCRDPKHFQLLLNWMRDGWCALPAASLERMEIAAEAEAYSLHGMLAWLKTQPGAVHSPGLGPRSSPGYAPANPRPYSASANASPRVTYTAYSSPPPSAPQYHQQPQLSPGSPQPRSYTSYTSPRSPGTDPAAGIGSAGVLGLREAFRRATAPAPVTTHIPSPRQTQAEERAQGVAAVPAAPGSSGKWTSKCLQTNDALRTVSRIP